MQHQQKNLPSIDLGACSKCGACLEVAPDIFRWSESGGYVEVNDLDFYDPALVDEAIKWCPEHCIYWETDDEDRRRPSDSSNNMDKG